MTPAEAAARRAARQAALQMLYQCEVGRAAAIEAIATYWPARDVPDEARDADEPIDEAREADELIPEAREADELIDVAREADELIDEVHREFANSLVRGTLARQAEIDARLAANAQNWRVERMNVLDRLVLRLGVYELLTDPATPAKVIINEAIELARRFSGEESVPFVNGVLDAVRKSLGESER